MNVSTPLYTPAATAPATCDTPLHFRRFKLAEVSRISALLTAAPARTCDFTIGGIYMWIDYFRYRRAIVDDTLFIRGLSELDITREAYSLPVGTMPLHRSIALLRDHCDSIGEELRLSAVPEEAVPSLVAMGGRVDAELTDWADYLYDITPMATYSGKKMAKKRNHVNAFMAENPGYAFEPLTSGNLTAVQEFFGSMHLAADKGVTAEVERMQTLAVLDNVAAYPFEGAVLSTPAYGIVAFTLGEVRDDTLYVHIEKMRHDINGAGETVARLFAERMLAAHPALRYVNREEDAGDEGLRQAKQSYHPTRLLRKYDIIF
ncbi:MAG: phosphatidylglycerol lysyltransferase domain-containing protein [Candidatus Amulumruptor caecigallinarius]|nr:phosphatidylglycerol lysyltransferase domain-containing protein [Candidatus Amulumruptor caecigallinarius]MCM1396439.1 phosphatidylglycerol lysyltransferase domain-containing protein [Candidatus Amulumruptor caecigallinarius]MCM1453504.1 phosphatidylglycerol lysyltransferase domain-containing protein [bacterium]